MPNGIYLLHQAKDEKVAIAAAVSAEGQNPNMTSELAGKIVVKHAQLDDFSPEVTYRGDAGRFYSVLVGKHDDESNYFVVLAMDEREAIEPVKACLEKYRALLTEALGSGNAKKVVQEILDCSLQLTEKLASPENIKDIIIQTATTLLDENQLQRAQELIKLAEEVPQKLAAAIKSADEAFQKENYKAAEKAYRNAANLAKEVMEEEMRQTLLLKAEKSKKLPSLLKKQRSAMLDIQKPLDDMDEREKNTYFNALKKVVEALRICDDLEDDEAIALLTDLEFQITEAKSLSKQLDEVDYQIKKLLDDLVKMAK